MKTIVSLILILCFIPSVQADPVVERHKLAIELVGLISTNRPDDTTFSQQVADQIDRVIPQLNLSEKDSGLFREAAINAAAEVDTDRLIEVIAGAYANKLSAKELKGIIDFYKTDPGKAWLRENNAIEAEKMVQKKALVAEILEGTQRRFKELKKQNPD